MIIITGRPISKKNARIPIRRGRRIINIPSKQYRAFESDALSQLKQVRFRYETPVDVSYTFYMKGKLDTDIDNMVGGISDILEKSGIIENDKLIMSMTATKIPGNKEWSTEIEITRL